MQQTVPQPPSFEGELFDSLKMSHPIRPIAFVVGALYAGLACTPAPALSTTHGGGAGTSPTPSEGSVGAPPAAGNDACSGAASGGSADTAGGQLIGPQGGSISQNGATLVIPAGALPCDKAFAIEEGTSPPLNGVVSDIFLFGPDFTFDTPVTITIPMRDAEADAHVFWIPSTNGLVDLGGTVSGSSITAQVSRLWGAAFACIPNYNYPSSPRCYGMGPDGGADTSASGDADAGATSGAAAKP